jgi:hypothetical protein
MYCPNCKQEYDGRFCPECGTKLIEKPAVPGGVNLHLGDANAISGGLHVSDSHDVSNIDNSVHIITNTTSTVNNITQVSAQKTEMELLQERKTLYLNACKRAYEDNVLEQAEKIELDRYRMEIGLDEATADRILDQVRHLVMRYAQKTELTGLAKIKLKQLTEALKKNEVQAIMRQIDSFEALAGKFTNDELQYKYYLVLAALKHEKCIEKYENSKVDNYWKSFWSYFAYLKANKNDKASEIVFSLADKYPNYPEDNATLLAAAGSLIKNGKEEAKDYLTAVEGSYTPALQRFVDTVYLLLDPDTAKEMGATEQSCAFYLVNFFKQDMGGKKEALAQSKAVGEAQNTAKSSPDKIAKQTTEAPKQDTEADVLKKKWLKMTAETFKMSLEIQEPDDAISVLNMAIPPAMAGIPMAMMLTAFIFQNAGLEDEAKKWADKLMAMDPQNEDGDVMLAKGAVCEEGIGNYTANAEYAIAFYKAAAAKGNLDALCFAADMYYEGKKVEKNFQIALAWAKMAYEAKNAYGLYIYGRAYYEGNGVPKDSLNGKRLIREAAGMKDNSYVGAFIAEMYKKEKNI